MNPIVEKIEKLESRLLSKRRTGRTTQMVEDVISAALKAVSGSKILVLAHNQRIAQQVLEEAARKIPSYISIKVMRGGFIEVNGVTIAFKGFEYRAGPNYKYQKWNYEFEDNSINDNFDLKHIESLKKVLETELSKAIY